VLEKGKQILLLIRHLSRYSYIQSSLVQVLAVIEERKHLRKKLYAILSTFTALLWQSGRALPENHQTDNIISLTVEHKTSNEGLGMK
jgi:hypothetical protein